MSAAELGTPLRTVARIFSKFTAALLLCGSLSGCIVGGYSSGGGWFLWPGSLGLLVVVLLVVFLLRR